MPQKWHTVNPSECPRSECPKPPRHRTPGAFRRYRDEVGWDSLGVRAPEWIEVLLGLVWVGALRHGRTALEVVTGRASRRALGLREAAAICGSQLRRSSTRHRRFKVVDT